MCCTLPPGDSGFPKIRKCQITSSRKGLLSVIKGMDRQPYDQAYKYLFSSPRIACQLLHSFVDIPLVKKIRPEDLELVEKSFISDELERREADLIFKVNLGGENAYIYILMEFQSSPDKAIPVRMLNYITMFYDYLRFYHFLFTMAAVIGMFPLSLRI